MGGVGHRHDVSPERDDHSPAVRHELDGSLALAVDSSDVRRSVDGHVTNLERRRATAGHERQKQDDPGSNICKAPHRGTPISQIVPDFGNASDYIIILTWQ